jgi:hypothetical protein
MEQIGNGKKRSGLGGVIKVIAISSILVAVTHVDGAAFAQTKEDPAASAKAFLAASQVLLHPRCVNCHPVGDSPLQGDESRVHAMNVKRGPDGMGKSAMRCSNCHQATNQPGAHMPPGGPGWHLPAEEMPMVFEKRTPRELCMQLKDPAKNGNMTLKEVLEHVQTAPLVLWGWNPGEGRTSVSMPHNEFVRHMAEWVEKGAACPE